MNILDTIPFYVVTFNRIHGLKSAVEFSKKSTIPLSLVILDMGSTWKPFNDYVSSLPFTRFNFRNGLGPRSLWTSGFLSKIGNGPFFLSDGDLDYSEIPVESFEKMQSLSEKYPWFPKVGLDLKTNDLPHDAETSRILEWNFGNTEVEIDENIFLSSIDTTIAYYPNRSTTFHYRPALRIAGDFQVIHYPWYERVENLNEEAKVYRELARSDISSGQAQLKLYWQGKLKRRFVIALFVIVAPFITSRVLGPILVRILSFRATLRQKQEL
jgi:hypothetical protein